MDGEKRNEFDFHIQSNNLSHSHPDIIFDIKEEEDSLFERGDDMDEFACEGGEESDESLHEEKPLK